MSRNENIKKIVTPTTPVTTATPNLTVEKVDPSKSFASKVDSATLITSLQKDLLRVHDYAMAQERSTTFVLSDFTIQLKAVVTQEGEKTLFALPTKQEELNPNTMSTINLTLRPIPLDIKPASNIKPIEIIEGITSTIGDRLRALGIETVSDLAVAPVDQLVKAGIAQKQATEYIGMAKLMVKSDLAGVAGVDEQVADLLVASKIDSKEKLAQLTPEELAKTLSETVKTGKVTVAKDYRLSLDETKRWIDSAKIITERTKA
jgi:hypothetical protein